MPDTDGDVLDEAVQLADAVRSLTERIVSTDSGIEDLRQARWLVHRAESALRGPARHHDVASPLDAVLDTGMRAHGTVVGVANPFAPPVSIRWSEDQVIGFCKLSRLYEGPRGYAHGGISSLLLDEVTAKAPGLRGLRRVTRHLALRYRRPVPLEVDLQIAASLMRTEGRNVYVSGTIARADEPAAALVVAEGHFVTLDEADPQAVADTIG